MFSVRLLVWADKNHHRGLLRRLLLQRARVKAVRRSTSMPAATGSSARSSSRRRSLVAGGLLPFQPAGSGSGPGSGGTQWLPSAVQHRHGSGRRRHHAYAGQGTA